MSLREQDYYARSLENNHSSEDPTATDRLVDLSSEHVKGLRAIHNFVERVCNTESDGDFPTNEAVQLRNRKRLGSIPTGGFLDPAFRLQYQPTPHIQAFLETEEALGLKERAQAGDQTNQCWVRRSRLSEESVNTLIDRLVHRVRSKNFRRHVAKRLFAAHENFRRGQMLIDRLFDRHSKLNVIRIDLGYRRDHSPSLAQVKSDFSRLMNNYRRNSAFDTVLGFIWRLEWAPQTGYHFHLLIFLDGSRTLRDAFAAHRFGLYWEVSITEGRGRHHNCNFAKDKYRRLGIGMTSHADTEKRGVLVHDVLSYLTKLEELARPRLPSGPRTFGTSQLPEPHPGTGRKRRPVSEPPQP